MAYWNEPGGERGSVAWNISAEQSKAVHNCKLRIITAFSNGHLEKMFNEMCSLKMLIYHDMREKEIIKSNELEAPCVANMPFWKRVASHKKFNKNKELTQKEKENSRRFCAAVKNYYYFLDVNLGLQGYYPRKKKYEEIDF